MCKKDNTKIDNLTKGLKECTKCGKIKDLEEYGIRNYETYWSYRSHCKKCEYKYLKERRECKLVRLVTNIRNRLYQAVNSKSNKTMELVSCSPRFLGEWLEYQFNSQMNWDNYGSYWVVDHVKPCSSYNLEDEEEQRKCFHWTNLRPLSASENSSKYNKIFPFKILLQQIKAKYFESHYT